MAIPSVRGIGAKANSANAVAVSPYASHVSGDLEILFVESANQAVTLSTAAGFVAITGGVASVGTAAGADGTRMTTFWRKWDGSAGSPTIADSGDHQYAYIVTFQDALAVTPHKVQASTQTPATQSGSATGVTTTLNNCLVVIASTGSLPDQVSGTESSSLANASLANLATVEDDTTNSGNGGWLGIFTGEKATAGASGTTTFTTVTSATKAHIVLGIAGAQEKFAQAQAKIVLSNQQAWAQAQAQFLPRVTFVCGAEGCSLTHWTTITGPITVATETKYHGTSSIKVAPIGAETVGKWTTTAASMWVARVSFYLDGLPAADAQLVSVYSGTLHDVGLSFDVATGRLRLNDESAYATNYVLGPTLVNQTWTTLDLYLEASSSTATANWKIDGVAQSQLTSTMAGAGTWTSFWIGQAAQGDFPANTTYTAYFDDIAVSNTASDYPIHNGYVASGEVWLSIPDSTSAQSQAQAKIKAIGIRGYAQSNAWIKNIGIVANAQAQASIIIPALTVQASASAQAWITRIKLEHQYQNANSGVQNGITVTITNTPTSGNLLVAAVSSDKQATAYTVDGFEPVATYFNTSVSGGLFWKMADGTETSVVFSQSSQANNGISAWVGEYSGVNNLISAEVSVYGDETTVTERSATVVTSNNIELVIAICGIDTWGSVTGNRAWSLQLIEEAWIGAGAGGPPGLSVADFNRAGLENQATFSWTGTADQAFAIGASFEYTTLRQRYAQAQAWIRKIIPVRAQAQAQIVIGTTTVQASSQAMADIGATSSALALAQARVKTTNAVNANAIADIKVTNALNASAQARIKTTYQGSSSVQADVRATSQGNAEAQARIRASYQGYGQSNVWIKVTSINTYAQGRTWVKVIGNYGNAQAQARIRTTYQGSAQGQADIRQAYTLSAQSQADIRATYVGFAQAQVRIAGTRIVFQDGFESGDYSAWPNSTPWATVITTYPDTHGGDYAIHCSPIASNAGRYRDGLDYYNRIGVMRGYFQFVSLPSTDLASFWDVIIGGHNVQLGFTVATAKLKIGGDNNFTAGTTTIVAGTWYRIDVRVDENNNPWIIDWQIDGVNQPQATPAVAAQDTLGVAYGNIDYAGTYDALFDDIAYSVNWFDYPIGPVPATLKQFAQAQGAIKVKSNAVAQAQAQIKLPITEGITGNAQALGLIGRTDNLYSAIDEVTPDDTDYIHAPTGNGSYTVEFLLGPMVTPDWPIDHSLSWRIRRNYDGFPGYNAYLLCGSTTIASWVAQTAWSGDWSAGAVTKVLSPAEIASISDYSDLRVRFNTTGINPIEISWVEFQVPSGSGSKKLRAFAQAQAEIVIPLHTYNVSAQAQAWVKTTALNSVAQAQVWIRIIGRGLAQAQGWIKTEAKQVYAQSQADIKTSYQGYAQSQARIKQGYQSYAQAQADIEVAASVFAQAQADIKAISNTFAQAQAWIRRTATNGYAQAQAWIKTEALRGYAQSQAWIKKEALHSYAQAQADIKQVYIGVAQAQADIEASLVATAQAQADIKVTSRVYAQAQADIKVSSQVYAQAQAYIKTEALRGYAQSQAWIKTESLRGLAQGQAWIKIISRGLAQAMAYIGTYGAGYAQAQADIKAQGRAQAQAQADIKVTSNAFAQAMADIEVAASVYAQAMADVKTTYRGYAQAQSYIKTTALNGYAQAQSDIKQSYTAQAQAMAWIKTQALSAFAQAQADIEVTTSVSAQAQAWIKISGQGYAQATTWLKVINNPAFGQAQADIDQTYRGYAQAQAYIKLVALNGYGQAQADIKAMSQAYAQAQADIKTTYRGFAQAQAWIVNTKTGVAQAQARIKNTYQGQAQAVAKIRAFKVNAFAQAMAWMGGQHIVQAQAQAKIRAFAVNAIAQSQSDIKVRSVVSAQAQAYIKIANIVAVAQAQANIQATSRAFAQAQAYIRLIQFAYAQAQAYIRLIQVVQAQAQADIEQTYRGYGQAAATIGTFNVKVAQAQADIKASSQAYAQAQADIEVSSAVSAQAKATIKQIYRAYAQARAIIVTSNAASAQAQAYIRLLGQAQAQAQATVLHVTSAQAQAQAWIQGTHIAVANAQAWIETTVNNYAQAVAYVKLEQLTAVAQAMAIVSVSDVGLGQAAARILQSYVGLGQAVAFIAKLSAPAQAQALIVISHYLGNVYISDRHSILAIISDRAGTPIEVDEGSITATISDRHSITTIISDRQSSSAFIRDTQY